MDDNSLTLRSGFNAASLDLFTTSSLIRCHQQQELYSLPPTPHCFSRNILHHSWIFDNHKKYSVIIRSVKMSRLAIDRRHKAKWSRELPESSSSSNGRAAALSRFIKAFPSKIQPAPKLTTRTEHAERAIEMLPQPQQAKTFQRKPVPRGPAERAHMSAVVETLNQDRLAPGQFSPVYEPKSYFDWDSDDDESSQVSATVGVRQSLRPTICTGCMPLTSDKHRLIRRA